MQIIQIRIGDVLCQFKSLTNIGADFIQHRMIREKATDAMIKSMIKAKHVALYLSN